MIRAPDKKNKDFGKTESTFATKKMYHKIHWYANILLYQVYARTAFVKREILT